MLENEFWLNRCVCNNSPRFTSDFIDICCAGQDVKYNLGVVDEEGDSLCYSLTPPLGGSYISPWSYNYPLTCLGGNNPNFNANPPTGFNFDPLTGDIAFRPMQVQTSFMKVMVTEWRKIGGITKVISMTSRDMLLVVIQNCNNKRPTLTGPLTYNFCQGVQTCFTINSDDIDNNDTTRISSNALLNIPAASFSKSVDTVKHAYGTFCWTPTANDVRKKPYYFVTKVVDNHCPLLADAYRTYSIYVKAKYALTTKIEKLSCADYNFKALYTDTSSHYRKWEVYKGTMLIDTFINKDTVTNYKFKSTGTYYIIYSALSMSFCDSVHIDTIVITNASQLNLIATPDTVLCKGNNITLNATPLNGLAPYKYRWYHNNSLADTSQSFTVSPTASSEYIVQVVSSDTCKMNTWDTVTITLDTLKLKVDALKDTTICFNEIVNVTPIIKTGKAPFQYSWYNGGTLISTSSTLSVKPSITSGYVLKITSSDKCFNTFYDTLNVTVDTSQLRVTLIRDTTICEGAILNITPGIIKGKAPFQYKWYKSGTLISSAPVLSVNTSTASGYVLSIVSADNCSNRFLDTFSVALFPPKQLTILTASTNIIKGQSIILRSNGKSNFNWIGSLIISNWGDSVLVKSDVTTTFILICDNVYGCRDTAQITINVSSVGVEELRPAGSGGNELRIYPNPAGDELTISCKPLSNRQFIIFNLLGQTMLKGELIKEATAINISSLSSGIYFIRVGEELRKFVKE